MNIKISLIGVLFSTLTFSPLSSQGETSSLPSYEQKRNLYIEQQKKDSSKGGGMSAEDMRIMKQAEDNLALQLPDPGLKTGSKAPDFTLRNAFGKSITLKNELKKGPVILVFYRGAWCPFCNMHLHTLQGSLDAFKKYNAQLIAVTPQQPDKSAAQIKKDKFPFEVVSDLDSSVMKAYNLFYVMDKALITLYKKFSIVVEDFNGKGRNVLPVPGTYIIDTHGIIRGVHADIDYKERMEPKEILGILKQL
jgi:peroxiredoxin